MTDIIYMNVPAVELLSKEIRESGNVLKFIVRKLDTYLTFLKTNAWVGQVGGRAVELWLSDIKPQLENLSQRCLALADKIDAAILDYQQGDHLGSGHFVGPTRTLEG